MILIYVNVFVHRTVQHTERATSRRIYHFNLYDQPSPTIKMESSSNESRILLAIMALQNNHNLSLRGAARIYQVSRTTLTRRRAGEQSRRDIVANSRNLTNLEEDVLLERILSLDARGFQPRLSDIQEMADRLCMDRNASRVGPRWAQRFVQRQPKLITRFRRQIDYQRAKCEDPKVV